MTERSARPSDAPTSYVEMADVVDNLGLIVREARRARRLSLRAAAVQIGVGFTSLSRIESEINGCNTDTLIQVLHWLDQPTTPPTAEPRPEPSDDSEESGQ